MKWFIYLIVAITYSCSSHKSPIYVEIAHSITARTATKLKYQKDLHLIGTGGAMMDHIKMMAMSFRYYHEVDIDRGRKLLLDALHTYLDAVNSNEEVRPYLANYPFEPKNIEINIFISEPDGHSVSSGKITVMGAINGVLDYDIRNAETGRLQEVYRESYDQALQKSRPN